MKVRILSILVVFFLFHFACYVVVADSIDSAIIEEMWLQKQQRKEETKRKELSNINTSTQQENAESQDSKEIDTTIKQPSEFQHSAFDAPQEIDSQQKQHAKTQWFMGAYFIGNYEARYQSQVASLYNVSLQSGMFYFFNESHGLKGYVFASYVALNNNTIFSGGIGVDYFYHFTTQNIGIFAGVYADLPFTNRIIIQNPDIIINAGVSTYLTKHIRVEAMVGHAVSHDSAIQRTVIFGLGVLYIF